MSEWNATVWMEQRLGPWREDHYPLLDCYTVAVTNRRGERLLYSGPVAADNRNAAEQLARRINQHIETHDEWEPREQYWEPTYPVYGSEEYQMSGAEMEWAAEEKRMDEDGYGDIRLLYL